MAAVISRNYSSYAYYQIRAGSFSGNQLDQSCSIWHLMSNWQDLKRLNCLKPEDPIRRRIPIDDGATCFLWHYAKVPVLVSTAD